MRIFPTIPIVVTLAQIGSSVWSGTYTAAQADRGKPIYARSCARCHGDETANPLNPLWGDRFAEHWESRTLADLFRRIRDTMPPGAEAQTVSAADKLDVMAFVLQANGFPDGGAELTADDNRLAQIQITGRTGPAPIRTGTLVRVAGCLAQHGGGDWQLTGATDPERAALRPAAGANPASPTPTTTGMKIVALLNPFPRPDAHLGQRMMATGFLIRGADGDAVNVVSLEMIAPTCSP